MMRASRSGRSACTSCAWVNRWTGFICIGTGRAVRGSGLRGTQCDLALNLNWNNPYVEQSVPAGA